MSRRTRIYVILLVVVLTLIGALLYAHKSKRQDYAAISQAYSKIKIPAEFRLVSTNDTTLNESGKGTRRIQAYTYRTSMTKDMSVRQLSAAFGNAGYSTDIAVDQVTGYGGPLRLDASIRPVSGDTNQVIYIFAKLAQ